jgi:hypothetical protein
LWIIACLFFPFFKPLYCLYLFELLQQHELFLRETLKNNNRRQYNQLQEHEPFPRKNKQQSSSIQPTTRTRAIPPEKQTTIIVNTTNYNKTNHSPGKTNNNRRQYNQLQQHEPFPRKNKQ